MEKIIVTKQVRIKRRLSTTPEELVNIAHQLREAAKFAQKGDVVEIDVTNSDMILTLEFNPEKTSEVRVSDSSCERYNPELAESAVAARSTLLASEPSSMLS